jgi:maltose alpha-D-glucosyltransferase/alpha-amylase
MMTEPEAAAITGDFPNAVISRIKTSDMEALLCDGAFSPHFHHALLKMVGEGWVIQKNNNELSAEVHPSLQHYIAEHADIKSKVVQSLRAYTAIVFDNSFFVKIYRVIERSVNPDVEMTRYFSNGQLGGLIPEWKGSVRWMFDKDVATIGMVQNLVEYHGNGSTYMQERLNNLNDKIFARNKESLPSFQYDGGLMKPIDYETLPENLREFLGAPLAEGARMIGVRLANMHSTLAAEYALRDFTPENFSLHYQRSLYAGMQTLVRTVFQTLSRKMNRLPADVQAEASELLGRRHEILAILKNIYSRKFDITKTRIHGFFHLEQVLFTGKDIAVPYLGGDPARSFSERRLKRSPLKDVASMITSFYYAAQSALRNGDVAHHDISLLSPYYSIWTTYVSGFFMHSYLQSLNGASFLPAGKSDLELLLRIYLLEGALQSLQQELVHRTESAAIAIGLIRSLLSEIKHATPDEAGRR